MHSKVHFTLPHVPKHKYLQLKIQIQLHIIFTLPLEFTLLVKLIKKKKTQPKNQNTASNSSLD